jgi:hypothetical protein
MTRLELLERLMYGRAHLDLLRIHVFGETLHQFWGRAVNGVKKPAP